MNYELLSDSRRTDVMTRFPAGKEDVTGYPFEPWHIRYVGEDVARQMHENSQTLEAERKLGKDRILELYLNIIYYGNGVYGVGDAARFYFGKEPKDL